MQCMQAEPDSAGSHADAAGSSSPSVSCRRRRGAGAVPPFPVSGGYRGGCRGRGGRRWLSLAKPVPKVARRDPVRYEGGGGGSRAGLVAVGGGGEASTRTQRRGGKKATDKRGGGISQAGLVVEGGGGEASRWSRGGGGGRRGRIRTAPVHRRLRLAATSLPVFLGESQAAADADGEGKGRLRRLAGGGGMACDGGFVGQARCTGGGEEASGRGRERERAGEQRRGRQGGWGKQIWRRWDAAVREHRFAGGVENRRLEEGAR
ncbi:hypothetical protein PR202_gb10446 [Eleusine coracana subsp. coracana]|uniref:Uncharacterized protein n=1 Tax=Eleusine coracana subsp. coracana TaxID=191504 RepID=A0AAV5EKY4_ELECO|nr:hypothetical protein PR202_gb10446 [Eleusine coracana subsp. coracana]